MTETEITGICAEIARMMIAYGAEIYRVEDTVFRICCAYGCSGAEIYATPANFMITVKDSAGTPYTDSKTVSGRETNLDRVGKINELSRFICAERPSAQVINHRLEAIKARRTYSPFQICISYFIVGTAFTVSFGGDLREAVFGGLLALVINFITVSLRKVKASAFLNAVVSSAVISIIAAALNYMGVVQNFDKMIIGASMCLVPGVALTNCMRDFISGDFLSGIYTLTEALLISVGMAVGAGSAVAAVIKL